MIVRSRVFGDRGRIWWNNNIQNYFISLFCIVGCFSPPHKRDVLRISLTLLLKQREIIIL